MIIRTNPPGAWLRGRQRGRPDSGCSFADLLRHSQDPPGQRRLRDADASPDRASALVRGSAVGFLSENLVPGKIRDERTYDYQLSPQGMVPQENCSCGPKTCARGTQTTPALPPGYRVNPPCRASRPRESRHRSAASPIINFRRRPCLAGTPRTRSFTPRRTGRAGGSTIRRPARAGLYAAAGWADGFRFAAVSPAALIWRR